MGILKRLRKIWYTPEALDVTHNNVDGLYSKLHEVMLRLNGVPKTFDITDSVRLDIHHQNIVRLSDAINHLYAELHRLGIKVEMPKPHPIEDR